MKSVGEAMGIGRTFTEAFLKAFGSRELDPGSPTPWATIDDLPEGLHPWFVEQLEAAKRELRTGDIRRAKRAGWGDDSIGAAWGTSGDDVRRTRYARGIRPSYRASTRAAARSRPARTTSTRPGVRRTRCRRRVTHRAS
jgi:carbamoyl-phosphate synthase large subunit